MSIRGLDEYHLGSLGIFNSNLLHEIYKKNFILLNQNENNQVGTADLKIREFKISHPLL